MSLNYDAFLSEERPGVLCFGGTRMALLEIEAGFWGLRRQMEALVGRRLQLLVRRQLSTSHRLDQQRSTAAERKTTMSRENHRPDGFEIGMQITQD